jgi:hypothetical protein
MGTFLMWFQGDTFNVVQQLFFDWLFRRMSRFRRSIGWRQKQR